MMCRQQSSPPAHTVEREREASSRLSLLRRALSPPMRALPVRPRYLSEAPKLPSFGEVSLQIRIRGWTQTFSPQHMFSLYTCSVYTHV